MDFAIPGGLIAERYRLEYPLGTGGTATVWAAGDLALGRRVAVKLLTGAFGDAEGGERLRREARALATLAHPHIVTVFDYLEAPGPGGRIQPVLVTELLQGTGLDHRLAQGPLPPAGATTVCAQVADALAAAHRAGIVHRDVKPGNVMLTSDGAKLLDFGIARGQTDANLTGQMVLGTPVCMAPEQLDGRGAGPASDVYALGCLLYWCLAGQPPFPFTDIGDLASAHFSAAAPPLPQSAALSPQACEYYAAAMAKDPARRPSAVEFGRALGLVPRPYPAPGAGAGAVAGAQAQAGAGAAGRHHTRVLDPQELVPPSPAVAGSPRRSPGGRTLPLVLGGVAVCLAVALAIVLSTSGGHSSPTAAGAASSASTTASVSASASNVATSASPTATTPTLPDPAADPVGYVAVLAAQTRALAGQSGVRANTATDLANSLTDLQNAVESAQNNSGDNKWHDVRKKINDLSQQVSDDANAGRLPSADAEQLTAELDRLASALPSGGGDNNN